MSDYPTQPQAAHLTSPSYEAGYTKDVVYDEKAVSGSQDLETGDPVNGELRRDLKSRHMQFIAIGGAIGAGLFVGSGGALSTGGPASLVICYIIIGGMLLLTMQALAELAVLYPVNGAFFTYNTRFISRSWGFATGWDYAIQWLTVLPFEVTAASLTIQYWQSAQNINNGVWITIFLVALVAVQFFGVKGYGEVEFVLSLVKVTALLGFIILGIVINCGGTPGGSYIGGQYWSNPGAFNNGFQGFCSVFVIASFAFGGTELVGLAAAESADPLKAIPKATKQVFWRIALFYVVSLTVVGLIVPYNAEYLLNSSGANTAYSPFVVAIKDAGIAGLPSVMNVVILLSVLSVANSCTFGSTRTLQALATEGMAPKIFQKIDKNGRPIWCIVLQLVFGLLAFIGEGGSNGKQFFYWMLALSGLANFFIWGSICFAHIRFRAGWLAQGRTLAQIPYKAPLGIYGSWAGLILNMLCIVAAFYAAVWPPGGYANDSVLDSTAYNFFQQYLAAPVILALYLGWKLYTRDWTLFIRAADMDVTTGAKWVETHPEEAHEVQMMHERKGLKYLPGKILSAVF